MGKLTLTEWFAGSIDDRSRWLNDGRDLDQTSHIVLGWALAFRDHGAHVSDESMLAVYRARVAGYEVVPLESVKGEMIAALVAENVRVP